MVVVTFLCPRRLATSTGLSDEEKMIADTLGKVSKGEENAV